MSELDQGVVLYCCEQSSRFCNVSGRDVSC